MNKNKTLFINRPLAFNIMLKPIGSVCNLNCTYCYYLEKKQIYKNTSNFKMHDNVLEKYIEEYIQAQQVPVVSFVWQGGEPTLLGLDYYKKVLELQDKYSQNKRIENIFQTNGTLLNDDWCKFFKDNNFLIGVSIDGPEHIHDHHRTYAAGNKPSHKDVMRGIKLLQKYSVEFNTLSVVNKHNSTSPIEVYNFLKDIGSQYLQFIPIVERVANNPVSGELELVAPSYGDEAHITDWSVDNKEYGRFLISIFDEWVRKDVGKTFVQIFDVTLANWAGERPGLCVFSETCGDAAVMEHNGDVYTCDHFVYPEYYVGNIMDKALVGMAVSDKQIKFGSDKRDKLPPYCLDCEYRFACNGECPKHRFEYTPDGDPGLNYLCPSYKLFFKHVHPYMQYMNDQLTKKKAPANVMEWVRKIDARQEGKSVETPKVEIGRNDPCPCGSGKKYKNCCMNLLKF